MQLEFPEVHSSYSEIHGCQAISYRGSKSGSYEVCFIFWSRYHSDFLALILM